MDKNDMAQNFCAVSYSGGKDSTYMLPLGSFKPSWTVEKLDQRFADEEKKR
ncbi:MAG: hypothetical protein IJP78_04605 [Clostridia bacterium]|nr:hypothetical protein [Clostridia bacterium]